MVCLTSYFVIDIYTIYPCEVNFGILGFWDFGEKSQKIPKFSSHKIYAFSKNECGQRLFYADTTLNDHNIGAFYCGRLVLFSVRLGF